MGIPQLTETIKFGKQQVNKWKLKRARELAYYYDSIQNKAIKPDKVLFESYHAVSTTGNVYAIYHELCQLHPELKKYWVYLNDSPMLERLKKIPNTYLVKYESKQYFELLATAKYLFNDTSFMPYFVKRSEQIYTNTWHGTPLKTLGKDIIDAEITAHKNIQRNLLMTDYLMMPNQFTADKLITSHDCSGIFPGNVFITGNARVDRNFEDKQVLQTHYDLNPNKQILLYAPTWKKSLEETSQQDIKELVQQVERIQAAVGEQVQVLLKSHYFIYQNFVELGLQDKVVPDWVDTNEFLGLVDGLITDYSSIFFDFLPNDKPIYFYMPDLEEYVSTRGLYLDIDYLPGEVYETFDELLVGVQLDSKTYLDYTQDRRENYLNTYCAHDDGQASKRIIEIVFQQQHLEQAVSYKNDKQVIAVYAGGLFNNGITNSLINLSNMIDYDKYELIILEFDTVDRYPEKQNNLEKLNPNVKLIYRFGRIPQSYNDSLMVDLFFRRGKDGPRVNEEKVARFFQTDFRRTFGNLIPDVMIDFGGYNKVMNALIGFSPAKKKIAFFHNLMLEEYNKVVNDTYKHRWNLKVIFSMYNHYDKIISVTDSANEANKQALKTLCPAVDTTKMDYLENLINHEEIFQVIKSGEQLNANETNRLILSQTTDEAITKLSLVAPLKDNDINFVMAARFSPEKNHLNVLEAFKHVVKHTPQAKLHLLGDGPLFNEVKKAIIRLGLSQQVYLYGHVDQPQFFVSQCDCAVLFSNYEGQGMFLLESMIAGLPVIGTDVPGINSVIISGKNGLLVPCSVEGIIDGFNAFISEQVPQETFDYNEYNQTILTKLDCLIN